MPKTVGNLRSGSASRLFAASCLALALMGCASTKVQRPEADIMATEEGVRYEMRFFYGQDKTRLFRQSWLPTDKPKALVIVLHGLKEHGSLYAPLGQALAKQGYAAIAPDLRGHGYSNGEPQMVESFTDYLIDLALVIKAARTQFPETPVVLLGNELGGTIATRFAEMIPDAVQGLALSAPTVNIQESKYKVFALKTMAALAPSASVDSLRFKVFPAIARKEGQAFDPLIHAAGVPARTAKETLDAAQTIQTQTDKLKMPVLIMHGVADQNTPLFGSIALYDDVASDKKVLRQYPELAHDPLRDEDNAQVISDLTEWLRDLKKP